MTNNFETTYSYMNIGNERTPFATVTYYDTVVHFILNNGEVTCAGCHIDGVNTAWEAEADRTAEVLEATAHLMPEIKAVLNSMPIFPVVEETTANNEEINIEELFKF